MKRITRILSCFVVVVMATTSVFAQNQTGILPEATSGAGEYYKTIRANQVTGTVSPEDVQAAQKAANMLPQSKSITWTEIGPDNFAGKTRAIIVDRNNTNVIYAGSTSGGLWKSEYAGSSWTQVFPAAENNAVTCIAQDVNGIIYFGTGEGFEVPSGSGNTSTSFIGGGIYKSTDATGTSFEVISSTVPTSLTSDWIYTYEMKADPNTAKIYVATEKGLKVTTDGGANWDNPVLYPTTSSYKSTCTDVEVASDGSVYTVVGNRIFHSPDGTSGSFTVVSIEGLTVSTIGRIELAVAPSDPNCVYASVITTTGTLKNIYRSYDAGLTWTIVAPGGSSSFDIYSNYGMVSNTLAVDPANREHIYAACLNMWEWTEGHTWQQISSYGASNSSSYYLHEGINEIFFVPNSSTTFYIATNGGISRTVNAGASFQVLNRNLSTVQFHNIISDRYDHVIGGTQNNGILSLPKSLSTTKAAAQIMDGVGAYSAYSYLNSEFLLFSGQYGSAYRSQESGSNAKTIWSAALEETSGAAEFSSYITPMILRESINDATGVETVMFTDTVNYAIGDQVTLTSNTADYRFTYTFEDAYTAGDTVYFHDPIQARLFVGCTNAIRMTKQIHDFSKTPSWWKIANISGEPQSMAATSDADVLFVGTTSGDLYRITNILSATDSINGTADSTECAIKTDLINSFGRVITSVSIDPNDANRIVVTLGRYGNTQYVYFSSNALAEAAADVTFANKTGNLPQMPVYASVIEMTNTNMVIIGTELGLYSTENITAANPSWVEENTNVGRVPVYSIFQQTENDNYGSTNYGAIYVGSHGRGAFQTMEYLKINDRCNADVEKESLKIFPNPADNYANIEFSSDVNVNAVIEFYSLDGKLVKSEKVNAVSGYNKFEVNVSELPNANYKVVIRTNNASSVGNLIKM